MFNFFQVESPVGCCLYQAKVRKEIFYAFLPITDGRGGMDMQLRNMVTGFKIGRLKVDVSRMVQ